MPNSRRPRQCTAAVAESASRAQRAGQACHARCRDHGAQHAERERLRGVRCCSARSTGQHAMLTFGVNGRALWWCVRRVTRSPCGVHARERREGGDGGGDAGGVEHGPPTGNLLPLTYGLTPSVFPRPPRATAHQPASRAPPPHGLRPVAGRGSACAFPRRRWLGGQRAVRIPLPRQYKYELSLAAIDRKVRTRSLLPTDSKCGKSLSTTQAIAVLIGNHKAPILTM
jgi:hypothetical protein